MEVQQGSLVLLNLLSRSVICSGDKWYEEGEALRQVALEGGVYPNGPLVLMIQDVKNEPAFKKYTLLLPLSSPVEISEDSLQFQESLHLPHTLWKRHYEESIPLEQSYQEINDFAEQQRLTIAEPFYHVCLEINGDIYFDIHALITGGAEQ
ncbi:MAG: DUF5085 family protein [Sporolactobacillus sp.]